MGTSNWQNIPFCVESILLIGPKRVLDVGVGFGRWGILTREFGELWSGRVQRSDWAIRVEGVEAFPANVDEYHGYFYDCIHRGDARDVLPGLERGWDLVVFGDVLEHFERADGESVLRWAVDASRYVMVNVPLGDHWEQDEAYGNPYERHRAVWNRDDFEPFFPRRQAYFRDSIGREFGVFLLSAQDPQELGVRPFPSDLYPSPSSARPEAGDEALLVRVEALAAKARALSSKAEMLAARNEALSAELHEVTSSRGYRLLEAMRKSRVGPPVARVGKALLPAGARVLHGFRAALGASKGEPAAGAPATSPRGEPVDAKPPIAASRSRFEAEVPVAGVAVAICHPDWRGIRSSVRELFPYVAEIPDGLSPETLAAEARSLLDREPSAVVFHGFPLGYGVLARTLKRLAPRLPLHVVWHGSFLHTGEDYAWQVFLEVLELASSGVIDKVGFVKAGLAEIWARRGYRTGFLLNRVRTVPEAASEPLPGGPHLGLWSIQPTGFKPPYVVIAGASLVPGAVLHGSGASPRARHLADVLGLATDLRSDAVPPSEMPGQLARMHLNLYVTFGECAPMLPLESLSVGAPCLLGPNTHYFDDEPWLHGRLVVPNPDRADVIADFAVRALAERAPIVDSYRAWVPGYNQRAQEAVERFLEDEIPRPARG